MILLTALAIGFLGSLHCAGMCSPLAIAVTNLSKPALINRILYNGGRIISYGLQGIVAASVGFVFERTGLQGIFSVTLGILLIVAGFAGMTSFNVPFISSGINKLTTFIKIRLGNFMKRKTKAALITTGILNGLLPCGLTYMALSYCVTITEPVTGFLFMFIFGLGTLPVMLGVTSLVQKLMSYFNISYSKITTFSMVFVGLLLVSRTLYSHHDSNHPVDKNGITVCR
ncbi:MAG TPA: sulfite exporter TauE/SafE family protein [Cyclobacteriaceae bacterium]|nr:sulfite exporter TauE/SafE family protein [Cyclobacteriaceae bacterium]